MSNPTEVWKDIPGYEDRYQVSNLGRVRSLPHKVRGRCPSGTEFWRVSPGKMLRPGRMPSGHLSVSLGRHNSLCVHYLVLLAFVGPRPDGYDVCHIDGNPENNTLENLRYDTRTENILDVFRNGGMWRKLTLKDIEEIDDLLSRGLSGVEISARYNVSQSTVSMIKHRRYKACLLLRDDI